MKGHWENHRPGPGIALNAAFVNDINWPEAWANGYTWIYEEPYLNQLPQGGSPGPGYVNPAASETGDPNGWLPIVFGRRRVAAPILISREESNYFWQAIVVIGEGEIGSIGRVWCNGHEIANTGFPGFQWSFAAGTPAGDHNAFIDAMADAGNFPPYTSASPEVALPNTAYLNIQVSQTDANKAWGQLIPGGGAPTFEVEILTGRKVFDHRDGGQSFGSPSTWLPSDNDALCIRDILANDRWKMAYTTINDVSFDAAADVCDTMVGSPSAKRFVCNDLILERATVSQHLAQLILACNGEIYNGIDGVSLFIDVENANSPILTLDTATNFRDTKFETLSPKDQPTQIVATYQNIAIDFATDTIRVPSTLGAGVELREASYTFAAITDVTHATRAAAYILNQNTVTPVRASGTVSQAGVILGRGAKVAVTSSDGPAASPFIVSDAELMPDGGYSVNIRQYDASVYSDAAIDTQVPVITDLRPPWGAPTAVTFPVITTDPTCYWGAPRLLDAGTVAVGDWVNIGTAAFAYLDLGSGNAAHMGRFTSFIAGGPGVIYGGSNVQWSDDNSSWTSVSGLVISSWRVMSGPTTMLSVTDEWTTPTLAHRYWRVALGAGWAFDPVTGTGSTFYDVLQEVDPFVTSYEVHNSSANFLLGSPENDPMFVVVPAGSRPTVDKPLDLRSIVNYVSGTTQTARVCIVPVSNGLESTEPVLLIEDSAASGFYPVAQDSATATGRQAGAAIDIDHVAADFIDLDGAASPAVSAAGHARIKTDGTANILASINGGAYANLGGGGGSGTVTSVAQTVPTDILSVAGSPITGAGTLAITKVNQSANQVFAGPTTGSPASPAFRALVSADIPNNAADTTGKSAKTDALNSATTVVNVAAATAPTIGQILKAASGTAATWQPDAGGDAVALLTAKGDLLTRDASALAKLAVGSDTMALLADSSASVGLAYGYTVVPVIEAPTGVIDGYNKTFVLSQTPVTKVSIFVDGQEITGGRSWGQRGTGNKTIVLSYYASAPRSSVLAIYGARIAISTASPDTLPTGTAITWTAETAAARKYWKDVCWSPSLNLFVAVGSDIVTSGTSDGRIMTSPDGITWSSPTVPSVPGLCGICWSEELALFVGVCDSTAGGGAISSPDGAAWTVRTASNMISHTKVAWSAKIGTFAAVADSGAGHRAMYSVDGINWTGCTISQDQAWASVCWSDALNLFVAVAREQVANNIMTSPDGITWTLLAPGLSTNKLRDICWSPELGLFVAVSDTGSQRVVTSPDAITWTPRTSGNDAYDWYGVCWSRAKNLFVGVGNPVAGGSDKVMTSPDGITWTLGTSIADSRFTKVCSADSIGTFCAVAADNTTNAEVMISTG